MPAVLVASDKFKGSLSSAEVAAAVGAGIRRVRPDIVVESVPVADGGDGTLAAAVAAGFELVRRTATGPTGESVESGFARRGSVAVVELADVSGLSRLPGGVLAPMTATSRGTGELLAAAVDAGCTNLILGIGGSASTDGGAGLLRALGARLLDANGNNLPEGGAALLHAASLDLTALRERLAGVSITIACDVDNPLTGTHGAAAVYGPQKGATAEQVTELDAALNNWADLVSATATAGPERGSPVPGEGSWPGEIGGPDQTRVRAERERSSLTSGAEDDAGARAERAGAAGRADGARSPSPVGDAARDPRDPRDPRDLRDLRDARDARDAGASGGVRDFRDAPGAGAAGGVGFAGLAVMGAELRPGIELLLELVGFQERLEGVDLVITGEGALDGQTLRGKAVSGVAAAARAAEVPVVAVCGSNGLGEERLREAGIGAAYALTELEPDVRKCIAGAAPLLREVGARIAADWSFTMTGTERGVG